MRVRLEQHLGSAEVSKVVYGSIIGLALVLALGSHPPAPGVMVAWLLGTAVSVGLAELFSDAVGAQSRTRRRVTRGQFRHMSGEAAAVGAGVAFPAVFFVLSALGLFAVDTAFTLATWTGLGLIGSYGFWGARLAGSSLPRALVTGVLVALVGAVLVALKSLLH